MYKIKTIIIKTNKRIPIIINKNGIPEYYSLEFLILTRTNKAFNTNYRTLLVIKDLLDYFKQNKTNLSIIIYDIDKLHSLVIQFFNYLTSKNNKLSNESLNLKIISIKSFLKWVYNKHSIKNNMLYKLNLLFDSYRNNKLSKTNSFFKINQNDLSELIKNLLTDNNNKFGFSKKTNHRNQLILLILAETGMRIGELLNLRTTDIIKYNNQYYIQISFHDSKDLRSYKPTIKTSFSIRKIQISNQLFLIINAYILRTRVRSKSHKFLITSENSTPLSYSAVRYIFNKISAKINKTITAHLIRHNFAQEYLKWLIEMKGIDMERAKDELRAVCGWSPSSNMPILYTKQYIEELANKHNMQRISSLKFKNDN